jgi:cytochrome b involved in lipid metabolism
MAATISRTGIDTTSINISNYLASKNVSLDKEAQELLQKKTVKKSDDKYYLPSQVELHNAPEDCWLSWHGFVYDLTSLILAKKGR